jgi:hypothetical protein
MQGSFKLCEESLSTYRGLFDAGKTKELKKEDQVFCSSYYLFVSHLIENKAFTKKQNIPYIYHIGESHCLSYAHNELTIAKNVFSISPRITFGAKAHHFSQYTHNIFKAITKRNLDALPKKSIVLITFGEIDCRAREGIIHASAKTGEKIDTVICNTIEGYVSWFEEVNLANEHTYYFFNVPAPGYSPTDSKHINDRVAEVVFLFNRTLRHRLAKSMIRMIDVYEKTKNQDLFSNELYHCDGRHLDYRILKHIENQFDQ